MCAHNVNRLRYGWTVCWTPCSRQFATRWLKLLWATKKSLVISGSSNPQLKLVATTNILHIISPKLLPHFLGVFKSLFLCALCLENAFKYLLWFSLIQVALSGTQIWWTTEVNIAFARLEEGYENALKDYYKKQVQNMHYWEHNSPSTCTCIIGLPAKYPHRSLAGGTD